MGDGSIPPPDFNYRGKNANFQDDLIENDLQDSFQSYLDDTDDDQSRLRRRIQQETIENQEERKAAMKEAALEEAEAAESLEEADAEEEKVSEKEAALDEKFARRELKGKQARAKQASEMRESKKREMVHEEEVDKLEGEQPEEIEERGAQERGIEEKGLEEDPLFQAKKEIQQERDELSDQVHEAHEELDHEKAIQKKHSGDETQQADTRSSSKKTTSKSKEFKKAGPANTTVAANVAPASSSQVSNLSGVKASHSKGESSKLHEEYEAIAEQLLEEAEVLKQGDKIETTVSINMKGSIFDKGEVTVTAYRYRPLEVNLSFKKFSHQGTQAMQKNTDMLKKVLKEKSLKVHQLDIIED